MQRARQFADAWGSEFVNVGAKDHINASAGFGDWNEGLELLKRLD
ncbi:MAG: alpha/beta hydrolase [Acidobacteriota bacterium]|nr:alpha/beta hydrolase [Acidobacteriota bacterium]